MERFYSYNPRNCTGQWWWRWWWWWISSVPRVGSISSRLHVWQHLVATSAT